MVGTPLPSGGALGLIGDENGGPEGPPFHTLQLVVL